MWMNKCRKFRVNLALLAGNDLDGVARVEVERHLAVCPECRSHWHDLKAGQKILEGVRTGVSAGEVTAIALLESTSVWPELRRQIRVVDDRRSESRWRGWLPAGALAAACLAVVVITSDLMDEPQTTMRAPSPVSAMGNFPVTNPSSSGSTFVSTPATGTLQERIDTSDPDSKPARRPIRLRVIEDGNLRSF